MKFLITKSNSDYYYSIKDFLTIKDLMEFMEKSNHNLILKTNWASKDKDMLDSWEGMTEKDKIIVSKIPYEIEIYNGYRE